jgi:hypothetical protein
MIPMAIEPLETMMVWMMAMIMLEDTETEHHIQATDLKSR